jgi:hypothetical protein
VWARKQFPSFKDCFPLSSGIDVINVGKQLHALTTHLPTAVAPKVSCAPDRYKTTQGLGEPIFFSAFCLTIAIDCAKDQNKNKGVKKFRY